MSYDKISQVITFVLEDVDNHDELVLEEDITAPIPKKGKQ